MIVADYCLFLLPFFSFLSVCCAALHLQYLIILAERQELDLLLLELFQIHHKFLNRRDGVIPLHPSHLDNDLA